MNLQLHHVISDITGMTGLAIIDAILAGERDATKLASLRNRRVHATALALRMSAQAVQGSRAALGGYDRRMRAKLGGPKAITATAHKLSRVVYHLIKTGQPYDESIFRKHEEDHRDRMQQRLQAQTAALGLRLVPATVVP